MSRQKPRATHEQFIETVARMAIGRLDPEERERCNCRICYGTGAGRGARGITYFGTWRNGAPRPVDIVEICAFGEESLCQVAGTTIHEIGHVLAGPDAGHGKDWKAACERLGLRRAMAAGMNYTLCAFAPTIREAIWEYEFADGGPNNGLSGLAPLPPGTPTPKLRPCSQGVGTRGGKSRGKGSGSRMRKYACPGCGQILRAAADGLDVRCNPCGVDFERA